MPSLLTSGRSLGDKRSVGGLKAVYFADFGTLGATTIVDGEITAVAGTPDFFKYEIKGSSSLETKFFLVGLENGAEVNGGTVVSGAAMGDMSGFTLTMEGMEKYPPYFVTSTVVTDNVSAAVIDPNA